MCKIVSIVSICNTSKLWSWSWGPIWNKSYSESTVCPAWKWFPHFVRVTHTSGEYVPHPQETNTIQKQIKQKWSHTKFEGCQKSCGIYLSYPETNYESYILRVRSFIRVCTSKNVPKSPDICCLTLLTVSGFTKPDMLPMKPSRLPRTPPRQFQG